MEQVLGVFVNKLEERHLLTRTPRLSSQRKRLRLVDSIVGWLLLLFFPLQITQSIWFVSDIVEIHLDYAVVWRLTVITVTAASKQQQHAVAMMLGRKRGAPGRGMLHRCPPEAAPSAPQRQQQGYQQCYALPCRHGGCYSPHQGAEQQQQKNSIKSALAALRLFRLLGLMRFSSTS